MGRQIQLLLKVLIIVAGVVDLSKGATLISKDAGSFPLSIIHINDFHARFEEVNKNTTNACKTGEKCIGGLARVVTMVRHLKETLQNPIYLNAGDNFQGTLWYNLLLGNFTAWALNLQPPDAITIGNHEFDHQIDGVVPFLETINSKVVVANMDIQNEPRMQGLFEKSTIIIRDGRKIGVIGVMLSTTDKIAATEKLIFTDEAEAVKAEAERLKNEGVNIIIVLSHSGLDVDLEIAKNGGPNIDVVVGGHSHSFMWTGNNPPTSHFIRGEYPEIVTQPGTGHTVLVVQASCYTQYLGNLTVWFDDAGEIIHHEGAPIYLDENIEQDAQMLQFLEPYKAIVDEKALVPVGTSFVSLESSDCNYGDCNIGNMIADAFVDHYVNLADDSEWSKATIAFTNNGGIRSKLTTGEVNYGELKSVVPFDNTCDIFELKGKYLWSTLEHGLSSTAIYLQVSGLHIVANITNPVGKRLVSVDVLCRQCDIPEYKPINMDETYRIVTSNFLAGGGDSFDDLMKYKENYQVGKNDFDVIEAYFKKISPIITPIDGRFKILK